MCQEPLLSDDCWIGGRQSQFKLTSNNYTNKQETPCNELSLKHRNVFELVWWNSWKFNVRKWLTRLSPFAAANVRLQISITRNQSQSASGPNRPIWLTVAKKSSENILLNCYGIVLSLTVQNNEGTTLSGFNLSYHITLFAHKTYDKIIL